jgi:glycosyltransferase involved in cell wall biosynthesis
MFGRAGNYIGGVERQASLLAQWFAARGHRVSIVTWDEGHVDGEEIGGVRMLKICGRNEGLPGLRFMHPRWTTLNAALKRAEADVYYQRGAEYVTGQVALWTRFSGRKFVYAAASEPDCDPSLPRMTTSRERVLYRYGLRHADRVFVQTKTQQRMLDEGFGVHSIVIPSPCPGPTASDFMPRQFPDPASVRVLWVGRLSRCKRPDRLLDLAEACPRWHFDLVGPAGEPEYSQQIWSRAAPLRNVTVHGPVDRHQISAFYQSAACLCCTSDYEGFPNTFPEAWSHGLPVVSTVDPDEVILTRAVGAVALDVKGLADALEALLTQPDRWHTASTNARRYYIENHMLNPVMTKVEDTFLEVVRDQSGTRSILPPKPNPAHHTSPQKGYGGTR